MKSAVLACVVALTLGGCNASSPPPTAAAAPTPGSLLVAPSDFRMPEGGGCAGDVARYRAVQDDDLAMGQIAKSVYDQIHGEIDAAAQECAAGHDAQARAMVMASRRRHGYPTAL